MRLKESLGNWLFALLVFLFVADPTNTIFGLKSIVFLVLLVYNVICFKPSLSKLKYIFLAILPVMLSLAFAIMRGEIYNMSVVVSECTAFAPLLLLPWIYKYNVLKLSYLPVCFMVILVISLFWTIFFIPPFEHQIYSFTSSNDHTIMLSRRAFLGYMIFAMYCKATVAFLPAYGITVYNALCRDRYNVVSLLLLALFLHYFVISGTRSSMIFPLILLFVMVFLFKRNNRYMRYLIYSLIVLGVVALVALLLLLLSEEGEHSNMVKYAHLSSYIELFSKNPEYLFFGQGPGTAFYTKGFHSVSLNTEWSYLEIIRKYGVFSLSVFYLFFEPVKRLWHLSNTDRGLVLLLVYVVYLIIAGTNPLLFSSTGMLVLLIVHSYMEHRKNAELQ